MGGCVDREELQGIPIHCIVGVTPQFNWVSVMLRPQPVDNELLGSRLQFPGGGKLPGDVLQGEFPRDNGEREGDDKAATAPFEGPALARLESRLYSVPWTCR